MTDRIRMEQMGSISNAGHLAAAKKVWRGIDLCLNIYYYNRESFVKNRYTNSFLIAFCCKKRR